MFPSHLARIDLRGCPGLRIQWRRLVHNLSRGLPCEMCTVLPLVFVYTVPLYSQLTGHGVRTEGVNAVDDNAVFQFGLMVGPLIGLGKEGESYVLDEGRGR